MNTTKFSAVAAAAASVKSDLVICPVFEADGSDAVAAAVGSKQRSIVAGAKLDKFTGKVASTSVQSAGKSFGSERVLLVGFGKFDDSFNADVVRRALTAAFKKAKSLEAESVAITRPVFPGASMDDETYGRLVGEVAGLATYVINHRKTAVGGHKGDKQIAEVTVATGSTGIVPDALARGLEQGRIIAASVNTCRDLVNDPPSDMTPMAFAAKALEVGRESGGLIDVKLHRKPELEAMGAWAFLAVGRGSKVEPVLVEMTYSPADADPSVTLALVGKTVTFDSGGLDIKSADGMLTMKCDMAGGAATMQAIRAIAALRLPVRVKAIMAATENLISADSFKPMDVVGSLKGLSIEIGNTDAEGRLTLADAVEFAKRQGATHVVDIATLTGAIITALGDNVAGAFTNNSELMAAVSAASNKVGELVHELPMHEFYSRQNDTPMADIKNTGGPGAGSITAAWFIRKFVEPTPWVHLDIAGVAFRKSDWELFPAGGSGFGVRLLVELAQRFATHGPSGYGANSRK